MIHFRLDRFGLPQSLSISLLSVRIKVVLDYFLFTVLKLLPLPFEQNSADDYNYH